MTAPKLPEGFQVLRDATAAVLAPIGNMTDRHTAVFRTMERRLAFQQACSPYTIDALLRALSDAQAALLAQVAEIAALKDALKLDAARWQYVRHHWSNAQMHWNKDAANSLKSIVLTIKTAHWTSGADELDAAIDSALLAAKEAK